MKKLPKLIGGDWRKGKATKKEIKSAVDFIVTANHNAIINFIIEIEREVFATGKGIRKAKWNNKRKGAQCQR